MQKYAIAIHGGAGTLVKGLMTSEKEMAYKMAITIERVEKMIETTLYP